MDKAINASLDYIIDDFTKQTNDINFEFYGDIFKLLKKSYEIITKKTNNSFVTNPLDVLNSAEMLYQFIILYVTYITVSNYGEFENIIAKIQIGGNENDGDEDGEEANEDGEQAVRRWRTSQMKMEN